MIGLPSFERLGRVVAQPVLLVAPSGTILAANPAATRSEPGWSEGRDLGDSLADPGTLASRVDDWLGQAGPVPVRLELRDGRTVRADVGRLDTPNGPVLLVGIRLEASRDRFARVTAELESLRREARYRREVERHQQASLRAEKASREQLERHHVLTSAFAAALTVDDVTDAIMTYAAPVVGADAVVLVRATSGDRPAVHAASRPVAGLRQHDGLLDAVAQPLSTSVTERRSVYFDSVDDLLRRYPSTVADGAEWFLAGAVPLEAMTGGGPVGALGFVCASGRPLSTDQRVAAGIVTAQCAQALERARLYDLERRFAETLQRALLPASLPSTEGVDCAVRYLPATELRAVGGDWYELFPLGVGRIGLAIGDVAGHGPSAATTMATMRNALWALATTTDRPGEVLQALNVFVFDQLQDAMATVAYLVIDVASGIVSHANAGHPPPLLVRPQASAVYLHEPLEPPIGVARDTVYREATTSLSSGTRLVLYTDGLIEQRYEGIDVGLERLRRVSERTPDPPGESCDKFLGDLLGLSSLTDDVTVLVADLRRSLTVRRDQLEPPGAPSGERAGRTQVDSSRSKNAR